MLASDLSGGQDGAERADRLFSMVSKARVLLKVLAVPGSSAREAFAAERVHYRLAPALWDGQVQPRFGPLRWDLMASDANVQLDVEGEPLPHYTR